jgi:hypothetical protein
VKVRAYRAGCGCCGRVHTRPGSATWSGYLLNTARRTRVSCRGLKAFCSPGRRPRLPAVRALFPLRSKALTHRHTVFGDTSSTVDTAAWVKPALTAATALRPQILLRGRGKPPRIPSRTGHTQSTITSHLTFIGHNRRIVGLTWHNPTLRSSGPEVEIQPVGVRRLPIGNCAGQAPRWC